MNQKILVVEDEPGLLLTLEDRLKAEGFEVVTETDGLSAERHARDETLSLIVLDVMLPGQSGFELIKKLRKGGVKTPVLMLTALGEVDDRVEGLNLGADDYLLKPFDVKELLARVQALLRRAPQPRQQVCLGAAVIDFGASRVTREGQKVDLSARAFKLLAYLLERAGQAVSREELLLTVWGHKATPDTRTVDVHIGWLRKAIEPDPGNPEILVTVHGVGYRLDPPAADA